ncbi:diguanylate cyclase [Shewanella waksmanii]|uniref:sensor domain-containing diguanylate cyclase n=1 Tax=Shewanella waksmanii TaxID=213783 RepID=UPI003736F1E0
MLPIMRLILFTLVCFLLPSSLGHANEINTKTRVDISQIYPSPIGKYSYVYHSEQPLQALQAHQLFMQGKFTAIHSESVNFGIGAKPAWIAIEFDNPSDQARSRFFQIGNSWLNRIELYQFHQQSVTKVQIFGDQYPFNQRLDNGRFFNSVLFFPPGKSQVILHVTSPDPMVLPIYLLSHNQAADKLEFESYTYGFLYGAITCLLIYNIMLFIGMRSRSYLLYSMFLLSFLLLNIGYTGHGMRWFWPQYPTFQQWGVPLLMMTFNVFGLLFALRFLNIKQLYPRLNRLILAICIGFPSLYGLAFIFNDQVMALILAFDFMLLFSFLMLMLGIFAWRANMPNAKMFMLASVSSMLGTATTGLAVIGIIPYNSITFRAGEVGLLIDVVLLGLALAHKFRLSERDKLHAEYLAKTDPLTGLNNRRAFYQQAQQWMKTSKSDKSLAVMIIDIDHFKMINDTYGHQSGDKVLTAIAKQIQASQRQQDITARWGGEEFIILLPQIKDKTAVAIAEGLRRRIAQLSFADNDNTLKVTASFGLAFGQLDSCKLEQLIAQADKHLYQAKQQGRDRVDYGVSSYA